MSVCEMHNRVVSEICYNTRGFKCLRMIYQWEVKSSVPSGFKGHDQQLRYDILDHISRIFHERDLKELPVAGFLHRHLQSCQNMASVGTNSWVNT